MKEFQNPCRLNPRNPPKLFLDVILPKLFKPHAMLSHDCSSTCTSMAEICSVSLIGTNWYSKKSLPLIWGYIRLLINLSAAYLCQRCPIIPQQSLMSRLLTTAVKVRVSPCSIDFWTYSNVTREATLFASSVTDRAVKAFACMSQKSPSTIRQSPIQGY